MDIVHIAPSLARGGGERLMIELANAASAAGHRVTVILGFPLPPERAHEGLSERVDCRMISNAGTSLRAYLALLPWLSRNRRWLARQDVIHCHMTFGAIAGSLVKWLKPFGRRPAIVETYHAVGMPIPRSHLWLHTRLAAMRDGLAFMVEHPYWREFLRRRPAIPASIIPAGISLKPIGNQQISKRSDRRRALGIAEHASAVVGTIGRLVPARQPWLYIPLFAQIADQMGPTVHFVVGGDGPEEPRLRREAAEHGLSDQIHFVGLVEHLEDVFSVLDLYVTLNVREVPGVAGLQAVAAGLPVIGVQASSHHSGGQDWIWSSADTDKLSAKAVELLRSAETRTGLTKAQRVHLEAHHSAAAMARDYEALYRRAIANIDRRGRAA